MRSSIKRLLRRFVQSSIFSFVLLSSDNFVVILAKVVRVLPDRQFDLLLVAPPGAGNIGDQALVEAALDNFEGAVGVVVRNNADFIIADRYADRVSLLRMPRLIYGHPIGRLADLFSFCRFAALTERTWLIGADVMDGAYNPLASVNRFSTVIAAARMGSDATVLGFSWNSKATSSSVFCAVKAARVATVSARDVESARRLARAGVSPVLNSADIVFSRAPLTEVTAHSDWVGAQAVLGRKVAVINASGLLEAKYPQSSEYLDFLNRLDPAEWSLLFVPHVMRDGNDDLASLQSVASELSRFDVHTVNELLLPSQVAGLLEGVKFVLTGRMHLAVLALSVGIIPVTMSSQGKVGGLYELIGYPSFCIEPTKACGAEIFNAFCALSDSAFPHVPESVRTELKDLSMDNFG